jgi:hypothetical protein
LKRLTRPEAVKLGLKEFHVVKPCKKGHTLRTTTHKGCLECRRTVQRKYYQDHRKTPQHMELRRSEERRRFRENPARWFLARCRARSKQLGLPFNLTKEDIVIPATCPVLGIPLAVGDRVATFNSPSIDRLVPSRGYVKGNVAIISKRANQIKNDATPAELRAVAAWLEGALK